MIISKIMGGLGNQMFCYAAGMATAARHGVELHTDTQQYPDSDGRSYELNKYNIQASAATESQIQARKRGALSHKIFRVCRKFGVWPSFGQRTHFVQRGHAYDPLFSRIGPDAYLHGLFQSEKFFAGYESLIRKEFTLLDEHLPENIKTIGKTMSEEPSVSLHVRRSDYLNHPVYSSYLEQCPREYYHAATGIIKQRLDAFQVYVFSDDPDWCRGNLDLPCPFTVMDLNPPDKPWLDLYLMSSCRHHIIANSTFSWWGAWLGQADSQMVIAPSRWMKPSSVLDDRDIVPERWIKI